MKNCLKCGKEITNEYIHCFNCFGLIQQKIKEHNLVEQLINEKTIRARMMVSEIKLHRQYLETLKKEVEKDIASPVPSVENITK